MANETRVRIADTVDHYLICDRKGTCAAVEFLDGKAVFHTSEAMPIHVLANQPYRIQAEAWQTGQLTGQDRFRITADRVRGFQSAGTASAVDYAFETLRQVSGQVLGQTPTQWSIVFDIGNRIVYFHTSHNPQIRSLDFTKLDFSCGSLAQMLDVHAQLSGDISDKLGQYTFEANLRSTLNYLEKYGGVEISELEVEVLERGISTFPCEQPPTPYQEEIKLLVSPVVGWAALTLFHRYWFVGIILGIGIVTLAIWRIKLRSRHG